MARMLGSQHVRLRYLPADRRLHITSFGCTTSGYLAEASLQYTLGEPPSLHLELEESEYDLLFSAGIDAATVDIRADRILVADVQALLDADALTTEGHSHPRREMHRLLQELRPWMQDGEPPPCEHEDVIETPALGQTIVPGICVWCPVPLAKVNDEWTPA